MQILRASPLPIVLLGAAGGLLWARADEPLSDIGTIMLLSSGLLFAAVLWGGVYLQVVESSRGLPGLTSIGEPVPPLEAKFRFDELKSSLQALGFRDVEWFMLDDFDATHVGAWRHATLPTAAFILCYGGDRIFRLRFARVFPEGGILVSSTRTVDLSIAPPAGIHVQVKPGASVEELWKWHLEAEALFPNHAHEDRGTPRRMFIEIASRWAKHRRRDRTWLLAVEPVEELWRIYWLRGMPLSEQFKRGWSTPYWA